jgi:hypothetical protein
MENISLVSGKPENPGISIDSISSLHSNSESELACLSSALSVPLQPFLGSSGGEISCSLLLPLKQSVLRNSQCQKFQYIPLHLNHL